MSLKIKNYLLTGPFAVEEASVRANQMPVVYVIVSKSGDAWNPTFKALEVGDTGVGGMKFADHPNRRLWEKDASGKVGVYLLAFERKEDGELAGRTAAVVAIREALVKTNGFIPISGG